MGRRPVEMLVNALVTVQPDSGAFPQLHMHRVRVARLYSRLHVASRIAITTPRSHHHVVATSSQVFYSVA